MKKTDLFEQLLEDKLLNILQLTKLKKIKFSFFFNFMKQGTTLNNVKCTRIRKFELQFLWELSHCRPSTDISLSSLYEHAHYTAKSH